MIKSAKVCDIFSTYVQFLQGFWPNLLADFWQNQVLDPNNVSLCKGRTIQTKDIWQSPHQKQAATLYIVNTYNTSFYFNHLQWAHIEVII